MTRTEQLEDCLRKCWGVMLFADSLIDDPRVKAAFVKVDSECRRTGLLARGGFVVIDAD